MIISCPSCKKKFEIDATLIPDKGRTLECGSCCHKLFYRKKLENIEVSSTNIEVKKKDISKTDKTSIKQTDSKKNSNQINLIKKKDTALIKYNQKTNFNLTKILSYIIVFIITFIALVIILDTFKDPLSLLIPNIEQNLFSLFELFRDILSFIKDLIK